MSLDHVVLAAIVLVDVLLLAQAAKAIWGTHRLLRQPPPKFRFGDMVRWTGAPDDLTISPPRMVIWCRNFEVRYFEFPGLIFPEGHIGLGNTELLVLDDRLE